MCAGARKAATAVTPATAQSSPVRGVAAEGFPAGEQEELRPGGEGDAAVALQRDERVSGAPERGELRQVDDAAGGVGDDEGEVPTIESAAWAG